MLSRQEVGRPLPSSYGSDDMMWNDAEEELTYGLAQDEVSY